MILNREELFDNLQVILNGNTNDDIVTFLEDLSDTYDSFSNNGFTQEDIDTAVNAKDEEWRKKYTERFFKTPIEPQITPAPTPEENIEPDETLTIDKLFD